MNKYTKTVYFLSLLFIIPLFLLLFVNSLLSLFQTTYMETQQIVEIPLYKSDRSILVLVFLMMIVSFIVFLAIKTSILEKYSQLFHILSLVLAGLFCIAILCSYKATACCDSQTLVELAASFLNGDYSSFSGDNYLAHYPHQVGLIGLLQVITFLFGAEKYLVFQIMNLIAILIIIHLLYCITELLFHNKTLNSIISLLSIGLVPLFSFVTFVYGDILGLAFALGAITLLIRYLQEKNPIRNLVFCSLSLGFAILLKSNNMIILVACIIILTLHAIQNKKWQPILYAIGILLISTMISSLPVAYYRQVSKVTPFPDGIPKIAWIAMGLQENDSLEDGWYNSYNWSVYTNNHFDTGQTKVACYASIQDSLSTFVSNPKRGARFFYNKFKSQWNDPGFQSQITNEWSSRHQARYTDYYNWLVFGQGKKVLEWIMNLYHFLILASTLISVPNLINRKTWDLPKLVLPLCIFGGYLFHLIWEAQARYALPYFVMMIPLAGIGIYQLSNFISHKHCKHQQP